MERELLLKLTCKYLFNIMWSDKGRDAREYLNKRGIPDHIIKGFGIGYNPPGRSVINFITKDLKASPELFANFNNESDYFGGYITFPVVYNKAVTGITSRLLIDTKHKLTKHKHLRGGHKEPFGANDINNPGTLIIVESPICRLTLKTMGYNSIASFGTGGITKKSAVFYKNYKGRIVLMYDNEKPKRNGKEFIIPGLHGMYQSAWNLFIESGRIAEICILPKEDKDKVDINSLYMEGKRKDFFDACLKKTILYNNTNDFKKRIKEMKEGELKKYKKNKSNYDKNFINIEEIKKVPISEIINNFTDKKLMPRGNMEICSCPLHDEDTASFTIYKEQNRFHCFGCHADGDAIDLVQKLKECNFVEALKMLKSLL